MQESPIELHQFQRSHYNEKVRWALDYKNVAHVRINYLPGPHVPLIRRLTGQSQVPVIKADGRTIAGSSTIIDWIEKRHPEPPLYPADAAARDEALALQAKFDAELGPEVRRAVFATTLHDADYVVATFAADKPVWKQKLYRMAFPAVRKAMEQSMHITPETGRRARERVSEQLDWIARKVEATGYLVGGSFTVADLTAAALLGPVALVHHPDMKKPDFAPPEHAAMCIGWSEHPGLIWANDMYRKHRPPRRGIVIA